MEEVDELFETWEVEKPEEWTSKGGVWLIVGDFNKAGTVDDMEDIVRVLSTFSRPPMSQTTHQPLR